MAQSYLIFDFGTNEEAAQQARHRIEAWKQAFRLGSKIVLKFERQELGKSDGGKSGIAGGKKNPDTTEAGSAGSERIRLFVRLDFSDHERLSHQRWLERIPTEEPFKSVERKVVSHDDDAFPKTAELFDSLS